MGRQYSFCCYPSSPFFLVPGQPYSGLTGLCCSSALLTPQSSGRGRLFNPLFEEQGKIRPSVIYFLFTFDPCLPRLTRCTKNLDTLPLSVIISRVLNFLEVGDRSQISRCLRFTFPLTFFVFVFAIKLLILSEF